mgnify:CR=1 FL=1
MMDFFNQFEPLLQMFWFIALPASLIFIIQSIMTFIGSDSSDGLDADFEGDMSSDGPFQLFSLRNLINFLLGFGWSGVSLWNSIENKTLLIVVATLIGFLFFIAFFFMIKQLQKLQEDNTFKIEHALHKTGTVYIPVPGEKSGIGKIQISIKGTFQELNAVTNGEAIPSGTVIKVNEILDDNLLLVEKI